ERMSYVLPSDNHVHTTWSYDTPGSSTMERCCRQAVGLGLPSIAFTEHLEFTDGSDGDLATGVITDSRWGGRIRPLAVTGYLADIAECRERSRELRILSGVEAGESHLFAVSAGRIVNGNGFDRVLGSLHAVPYEGKLVSADSLFGLMDDHDAMRYYFA